MLYRPGLLGRVPCPGDWYYDGGSPPIIDVDLHKTIPAGWTFSRTTTATNATYLDTSDAPAPTVYAADQPRFMAFGLLLERGVTQYYPNNAAPVPAMINLGLNTYTMWCTGPAGCSITATAAGAILTGTLVATLGVPATFTVTGAGNVNFTLVGAPTRVQLESGSSATSFVPTTAGPTTRAEDRLSLALSAPNQQVGTYWVKMIPAGIMGSARLLAFNNGTYASSTGDAIFFFGPNQLAAQQTSSGAGGLVMAQQNVSDMVPLRVAFSVSPAMHMIAANYLMGGGATPGGRPNFMTTLWLGGNITGASGYYQGFKYWDRAMAANELIECTEPGHYPDGPLIEQDFTTGSWPRRWTFTKSTVPNGTPTDMWMAAAIPGQVANDFASTAPRLVNGRGLMMSSARSNYVPNSSNVTGNIAPYGNIGAQTYCLSMVGTGSITAVTTTGAGTGFGVPATQGNPVYIRVSTAGNIGFNITGSVEKAQFEAQGAADLNLSPPTMFIKTTVGAQQGGADKAQMSAANWFPLNAPHTTVIEFIPRGYQTGGYLMSAGFDATDREQFFSGGTLPGGLNQGPDQYMRVNVLPIVANNLGAIDSVQLLGINSICKAAHSIGENGRRVALNGVIGAPTNRGIPFISLAPAKLYLSTSADTGTSFICDFRKLWIYDWAMSEAELIAITT